ncbi:MAG: HEAT repeat domain-containing protein, partial [Zavarzinella sp.]|nr:HEAT repeat domain-containing protein [Zavarzinella sp.]
LDRACYGDPGEMFRGLRHALEAIVNPRWSELADICLEAARSPRRGTRLWAIDQLTVLDDERARPVFEESVRSDTDEICRRAAIGLERLDRR